MASGKVKEPATLDDVVAQLKTLNETLIEIRALQRRLVDALLDAAKSAGHPPKA